MHLCNYAGMPASMNACMHVCKYSCMYVAMHACIGIHEGKEGRREGGRGSEGFMPGCGSFWVGLSV